MRKLNILVIICLFVSPLTFAQNIISQGEFSESGIQRLEVKGAFGKVDVQGSSGKSTVDFKGEITGNRNSNFAEIKYERQGNTMKVWIERPKKVNWNYGNIKAKLVFKVPSNIDLMIDNNSGSVYVSGITYESTHIEANSGSVTVENIEANAYIGTNSGSIRATNIKGNIKGKSNSGSQRWNQIKGNINTVANSGGIKFNTVQGSIEATTGSGGIGLEKIIGSLKLKANSGSLRGSNIELKANSAFKTSSGGISMSLVNNVENMSFDLTAGSGGLTVGKNRGGKRLFIERQGAIQVTGVSSSGSQRYHNE